MRCLDDSEAPDVELIKVKTREHRKATLRPPAPDSGHAIPLDIQGPPALDPSSPSGSYMEGLQVFNQDNHYISYADVG